MTRGLALVPLAADFFKLADYHQQGQQQGGGGGGQQHGEETATPAEAATLAPPKIPRKRLGATRSSKASISSFSSLFSSLFESVF